MSTHRKAGPTRRELEEQALEPTGNKAFSLVAALERCTGMITQAQAAKMVGVSRQTIWRAVQVGKIPVLDIGLGSEQIDPSMWLAQIKLRNPHLVKTLRMQAA